MPWEPLPADRSSLRPLDASLGRLRRTLGLGRSDTVELIRANWSQLVGARLAPHCEVHSLRSGVLVVASAEPAVVEQLRWAGTDFVAAVNAVCGGEEVTSVEVRVRTGERLPEGD